MRASSHHFAVEALAGLVLAADRSAWSDEPQTLRSWAGTALQQPPHLPFVDRYGRLTPDAFPGSGPIRFARAIVLPQWRERHTEQLDTLASQGRALLALSFSRWHGQAPLRAMLALTRIATRLRRIVVLDDPLGQPVGAFTWLHVSPRSVRRIRQHPASALHPSEWNEGRTLWIRDVAIPSTESRDRAALLQKITALIHLAVEPVLLTEHCAGAPVPTLLQIDPGDTAGVRAWFERSERRRNSRA